ncbi:MAG: hypothetical protein CALGDGBN_03164 [Pseudomonadales bacterium]|nr:hypothetical protein [Pseudomonadales bacterium]
MDPVQETATGPRSVGAERGLTWLTEGWQPFARAPGQWIALTLLLLVAMTVCNALPVIGNLLSPFVYGVFAAATLLAARRARDGASTELLNDALAFGSHPALKPVVIVSAIHLGLTLVAVMAGVLIMVAISGLGALSSVIQGDSGLLAGALAGLLPGLLLMMLAMAAITAMYWFAIPDVVFRGTEPWTAMCRSLRACVGNAVPLLVYGVLCMIAFVLAVIPFGLGLLVMLPVLFGSWLASYEDVYGAVPQPPAPPP